MDDITVAPLVTSLSQREDPRRDQAKQHSLWDILVLSVLAPIGGADNRVALADFGQANLPWLRSVAGLAERAPVPRHLGAGLGPIACGPLRGLLSGVGTSRLHPDGGAMGGD